MCDYFRAPNGGSIIVEVVVLVSSSVIVHSITRYICTRFSIHKLVYSYSIWLSIDVILCPIWLIIGCGFGIAAIKNPQKYRLGWYTVLFANIAVFPWLFFAINLINDFSHLLPEIKYRNNSDDRNHYLVIYAFTYIAFVIGSGLTLVIKHLLIYKQIQKMNNSNVVIDTSTFTQDTPPILQRQPIPYPDVSLQQIQPLHYTKKNEADMV